MDDIVAEARLQQVVDAADGPVLADEEMGMLPITGRAIQLQPFELTQLVRAGRWDQQPLLRSIHDRRYAAILIWIIPEYPLERIRWSEEMLGAVDQAYVLDQRIPRSYGETLVYRPRR
jgi:hypothetical protein